MSMSTPWAEALIDEEVEDSAVQDAADDEPVADERPAKGVRRASKGNHDRRLIVLALTVSKLSAAQRETLAGAYSMRSYDDDQASVVKLVQNMAANSAPLDVLRQVSAIVAADPIEAGVLATALAGDRPSFLVAWGWLRNYADIPQLPPASQGQAGLMFVRAIQSLDKTVVKDLSSLISRFD